jgi:copper chaperone
MEIMVEGMTCDGCAAAVKRAAEAAAPGAAVRVDLRAGRVSVDGKADAAAVAAAIRRAGYTVSQDRR